MTIQELCEAYKNNYFEVEKLDELLHSGKDFSLWLSNMKERSQKLQDFFEKNNKMIEEIQAYEATPFSSDEEAKECLDATYAIYKLQAYDAEFLMPLFRKLISYYEKKKDIPIVLDLYYSAMYIVNEIECRGSGAKADFTYQNKILELKRYYRSLDEKRRKYFFLVYYNLASVCLGMDSVTPQESYFWFKEAREFFYSDVVHPIDKDTPGIVEIFDLLRYDWIAVIDNAEGLSVEAMCDLFTLIQELYEKEIEEGDIYSVDAFLYSAYLEMERLKRTKTLGEVIEEYMEYFRYNFYKSIKDNSIDSFYLLSSSPETVEHWLSKSKDTFYKKKIFNEINDTMTLNWRKFDGDIPTPYLHQMLAEWCMVSLKYYDTPEEKENAIFELVIKNQIPTYLHSVMVMKLAEELFEVSYRKNPSIYKDLHMDYEELLSYIKKAALFHDIGKIKITDIINKQGRRLSNAEFEGVMNHPFFGIELIENDKDFKKYRDVIRYHHKYYDGTKGYPYGNENTKSIYRVVIDLISICDCVDAATDFLGRNYKSAKSLDTVLEELAAGMGTRYNPDLVKILLDSKVLQDRFRTITTDNREHYMYDAYLGSLEFQKDSIF